MVVMQTPDGSTCEYRLRPSKSGLRLARSCVSYDLISFVRDAGWRIKHVKTAIARKRLARAFGTRAVARPRRASREDLFAQRTRSQRRQAEKSMLIRDESRSIAYSIGRY
jgi:hypothetical protein